MTPNHEAKEKGNLNIENFTLSLRFILPLLMGVFFYVYSNDQNKLHTDIADIKEGIGKTWTAVANDKSQINCVQNQLAKCCKDSAYCI